MNFDIIMLNQGISKMKSSVIWIQKALLFKLELKMFIKILQMILKKDLIHQIMKSIENSLQKRIRK